MVPARAPSRRTWPGACRGRTPWIPGALRAAMVRLQVPSLFGHCMAHVDVRGGHQLALRWQMLPPNGHAKNHSQDNGVNQ